MALPVVTDACRCGFVPVRIRAGAMVVPTAADRRASGRPRIERRAYLPVTVKPCWFPYSTSDFCQACRPAFRSLLAA